MLVALVILLTAIVIAVPTTRKLGLGSVLGYLVAGVAIGPSGLGLLRNTNTIADISELGVVMLLFLIGLEVRPHRLWIMRKSVFGLGFAQMAGSSALIAGLAHTIGEPWPTSAALGMGFSLSSTAIVLPMLSERNLLPSPAGRDGFSILLFQDLAFVPMVALIGLLNPDVPVLAHITWQIPWTSVLRGLGVIAAILVGGIYLVPHLVRLLGGARSPEIFTATSLLIVVGTASLAAWAGLSMSLGAFLAGVIMSDSEFRHELHADIKPFEGLLLGFFFISVGMSADLHLFVAIPRLIILGTLAVLLTKISVLFVIGLLKRRDAGVALRLAIAIPQGSEFSFVLFAAARTAGVLSQAHAATATLMIALSMMLSPPLFAASERFLVPKLIKKKPRPNAPLPTEHDHAPVIICGFGRMGQVVGRVLRMHRISYLALDEDMTQLEMVRRFGIKIFYGNPTREDVLRAAGAAQAKLLVVALDDPDAALQVVDLAGRHFPHLKLLVRVRNRRHAHLMMDRAVEGIVRETFHSALELTRLTLNALGVPPEESARTVSLFAEHDARTLDESHTFYRDEERLIANTKESAEELRALFEADKPQ